jgi:corrinoid protein of di/trimethylamine methyltransferase
LKPVDFGEIMSNNVHIEGIREALLTYDTVKTVKAVQAAVDAEIDPLEAIEQGLAWGIREVGERFHRYEIYLPQMVMAADAMMEAMKIFESELSEEQLLQLRRGTVVLGTVEGDIHDLGKSIVAMMLKAAGFEVIDLGKDVKTDEFIKTAIDADADIIGASSLMTTTMPYQRDLIEELTRLGMRDRFKVIIGGGPVNREWAEVIGADGYGKDATEAVNEAERLRE